MQYTAPFVNKTLLARGRMIDLATPRVMGILNVTPDSFFDGNRHLAPAAAMAQADQMIGEGADFIDVGGYSSRPGAADISEEEELKRVVPVIEMIIKKHPDALVSIDTFRSGVAQRALDAGACMINDISGGELDPRMAEVVAGAKVPYVLMHMRGTPQTMNTLAQYNHLTKEIIDSLHPRLYQLRQRGVTDVVIDPGFGFAKTPEQNFVLLSQLADLQVLQAPMLVGLSRKSMIWRTLQLSPEEALNGTTVLNTLALLKGASILRVHDVREARQCIALLTRMRELNR
jgi:dihydropteroate synthase